MYTGISREFGDRLKRLVDGGQGHAVKPFAPFGHRPIPQPLGGDEGLLAIELAEPLYPCGAALAYLLDLTGDCSKRITSNAENSSESGSESADDDLILVEDIQSLSGEKEWYGWARQIGDRYFLVSVGPGCRCPSSTSESSDSEESSLSEESSGQGSESEPSDGSLSEGSGSGPSQGSFSEGSESQPSQGSLSEGSESQPSEEGSLSQGSEGPEASGSSKGTAIVPASWSPTGYTALFVEESPEVRFDDVLTATVFADDVLIPIDPKYLEVCAAGTVQVCGYATDVPVLIGAKVEGDFVRVKMQPEQKVEIVLRVTGLRKGFKGHRFPNRTRAQFESNERFINSAYDL